MATIYNHVQMGVVDANGQINVIYPITTGDDTIIDRKNVKLPESIDNLQKLADNLGIMAFEDGDDVVYFADGSNDADPGEITASEIDDRQSSLTTTYSSSKIDKLLAEIRQQINKK